MAVTIRLARKGAKKHAFYRIMVADSRRPRNGKFLEAVGTYNPAMDPPLVNLDLARVEYWVKNGAQTSLTVKELIKQAKKALLPLPPPKPPRPPSPPRSKGVSTARRHAPGRFHHTIWMKPPHAGVLASPG